MDIHPELRTLLELIGDPDNSHLSEEAERTVNESIRASMTTFGWHRLSSTSIKAVRADQLSSVQFHLMLLRCVC
jgi:hypothetical protein